MTGQTRAGVGQTDFRPRKQRRQGTALEKKAQAAPSLSPTQPQPHSAPAPLSPSPTQQGPLGAGRHPTLAWAEQGPY